MKTIMFAALAFAGAVWMTAPADAAPRSHDGITKASTIDLAAKRKHRRHSRVVVRTYEAPRYYGYYGPTYYERPYRRPAPVWFGIGGWW